MNSVKQYNSDFQKRRVIGVFAHNEEKNIVQCLESLKICVRKDDICVVLNNGSKDNTASVVECFMKENDFCRIFTTEIGDKANAWNFFIHELKIDADIFYFLDGDCQISRNALDNLEVCLSENIFANAAAALPSVKVSPKFRAEMIKNGGLAGNLYALSKRFVENLRLNNVYLPVGFIGDDSLVGALAYWDLNTQGEWVKEKIITCSSADFCYTRLSLFSLADIRFYYRRKFRYSLRYIQIELIKPILKQEGLKAIPNTVDDMYKNKISELRIKWRGVDTFFDYLAVSYIKKCVNKLTKKGKGL